MKFFIIIFYITKKGRGKKKKINNKILNFNNNKLSIVSESRNLSGKYTELIEKTKKKLE